MSQHVYARLAGHGWILLPLAPFEFERVPTKPLAVDVSHEGEDGPRNARIDCETDPPIIDLGPATLALAEVLDVLPGPELDEWYIETSAYVCPWPEGFSFISSGAPDPAVFYLTGPDRSLVFVQGPFPVGRVPAPDAMVGPGQVLLRKGQTTSGTWVEIGYTYEGQPWRQWHRVVARGDSALVVTAQGPVCHVGLVEAAAVTVAEGLMPYEDDE
jgi:hypothetical protein